jgi:hypothetical protein
VIPCFLELEKKANLLKCEYCGKYAPAEQFRGSKRFCSMTCAKRYCGHICLALSTGSLLNVTFLLQDDLQLILCVPLLALVSPNQLLKYQLILREGYDVGYCSTLTSYMCPDL